MSHPINGVIIFQKVVLWDGMGHLLALQRQATDDRRPGAWDLPGGGVEKGEGLEDAIIREIKEETGLTVADLTPVHVQTVYGIATPGVDNHFICWETDRWRGDLSLSDEHQSFRWVTPEEFAQLPTWDEDSFLQLGVVKAAVHR